MPPPIIHAWSLSVGAYLISCAACLTLLFLATRLSLMCSSIFLHHDLILDLSLIFLFQIFFVLEFLEFDFLVQPACDFFWSSAWLNYCDYL